MTFIYLIYYRLKNNFANGLRSDACWAHGPSRTDTREPTAAGDRYTHGHHESVLRSHRWRTAENSAAYLLPSLRPGHGPPRRRLRPGNHHRRPGPPGRAGIGSSAWTSAAEVIDVARATADDSCHRQRPLRRRRRLRASTSPTRSFDVVHAHQMLQHLADPVAALAEMGRVCRPGGLVAARDGDYAGFTWYPADPWLDVWLDLYGRVARHNGGEPDGGRRLVAWARAAGFEDISATASAWCFAEPADRRWWGELWADRMTESPSEPAPSSWGSPPPTISARSPPPGGAGRPSPTGGSASSTARSSAGRRAQGTSSTRPKA